MTKDESVPKNAGSELSDEYASDEDRRYAWYVLFVLVLVYVFNFLDRQILSVLAPDIKADLGISDANLGFLYGTAFAIFYAVFGIPISRLSDIWDRRKIIAIGLSFWSLMTALSGTARGLGSLALFRFGVGVGESSASPAAFSMLGDYFPPRLRATVFAIYSSGIYVGVGIGIFLGGYIVDTWNGWYPAGAQPFGLAGWQVAFFAVGTPGILLAIWVSTLREPVRGITEKLTMPSVEKKPLRELGVELGSLLPPFSLIELKRRGGDSRSLLTNLGLATLIAACAALLIAWLGSPAQWIGLGVGVYVFLTWVQNLSLRDFATFSMIYKSRAIVYGMIGFGWHSFVSYGLSFWAPSFFIRTHGVSATEVGLYIGLPGAIAGFIGITVGGIYSDRLKKRIPQARAYIGMAVALVSAPVGVTFLLTDSVEVAYVLIFIYTMLSGCWLGSCVAMANELVLPRMRAASSAFYIVCVTFIGLALGPYSVGRTSDFLSSQVSASQGLRIAMLLAVAVESLALLFLWLSSRYVASEEASRLQRARMLGEPV